ncbi:MAG: hypothetical protein AB8G86_14875 [Saprospiraceae bacterium]
MSNSFLDFKIIAVTDTKNIIDQCNGNAQNGIFICYPATDESMVEFLAKILSAVKLDLKKDVFLLTKTADNNFSFSGFAKEIGIQKAIFFGTIPQTIGLQINCPKYKPFALNDTLFLFADELIKISANQQLKKLLWNALKEVFA